MEVSRMNMLILVKRREEEKNKILKGKQCLY